MTSVAIPKPKPDDRREKLEELRRIKNEAYELKILTMREANHAYAVKKQLAAIAQDTRERSAQFSEEIASKIRRLNTKQKRLHRKVVWEYEKGSSANRQGKYKVAQNHFDKLRGLKAKEEAAVEERRQLVADSRALVAERDDAHSKYETASRTHGGYLIEYERTKQAYLKARQDYQSLKGAIESAEEKTFAREMAIQAGVPKEFWDSSVVQIDHNNCINVFFGGNGAPLGTGHGHFAMDPDLTVIYARLPHSSHGAHNYV